MDYNEMLLNTIKQISKESLVYGLGYALHYLIVFMTLPILTRLFSPADFGLIELVNITMIICVQFMACGMQTALTFYAYDDKAFSSPADVFTHVIAWNAFWGIVVGVIFGVAFYYLGQSALAMNVPFIAVVYVGMASYFQTLIDRVKDYFRTIHRPFMYIFIQVFWAFARLAAILALWFLSVDILDKYFQFLIVSVVVTCLVSFFVVRKNFLAPDNLKEKWGRLLKFGAPLVPAGLATYVMQTCDRWMIAGQLDGEALGIYAIGAKISLLMTAAIGVVMLSVKPLLSRRIHEASNEVVSRLIDFMFRFYLLVFFSVGVFLVIVSPWLLHILAPPEYQGAIVCVGFLVFANVLLGGAMFFTSLGQWKSEKTWTYSLTSFFAMVLNIILNYRFISEYGIIGAAVATALSALFFVILNYNLSQKLHRYDYHAISLFSLIFVGLVSVVLVNDAVINDIYFALGLSIVFVFAMMLIAVRPGEYVHIATTIRRYLAKGMNVK